MKRANYLFLFLLLPLISFSQNAIVKNTYLVIENLQKKDSIKSISYPIVSYKTKIFADKINRTIKAMVFDAKKYDTTQSAGKLLQAAYKNDKALKMFYTVNSNKNGFLSITIYSTPSKEDRKAPVYLNFDLKTGNLVTIRTFIKSRNDSISFFQGVIPRITDSVRIFEVNIDKNNPKYSDIIQQVNNNLADFRHHYPEDFILTDKEVIVYFDCILPASLLPYYHTYHASFTYKILRNIFKPEIAQRLNAY